MQLELPVASPARQGSRQAWGPSPLQHHLGSFSTPGGNGSQLWPQAKQQLPSTPEEASGQQELIVVGSLNNWSVRVAKEQPLALRLLPDGSWVHECRVQLNYSGELEFQVLSKMSAWEWCLYPEDSDKFTLVAGEPSAVKVGLSVLDGAHGKNFMICEPSKTTVVIKVLVATRDFQVWYEKDAEKQELLKIVSSKAPWATPKMATDYVEQLIHEREAVQERQVQTWRVIGGTDTGGIAVRAAASFDSEKLSRRLSTGALVREEERRNERICYERLSGSGPLRGWVSVRIPGKELLEEVGTVSNPLYVLEAPEAKKKKKKPAAAPPPPPNPEDAVEWLGGRSVFVRSASGEGQSRGSTQKAEPPTESTFWSALEHSLFSLSEGQYNPSVMSKLRREVAPESGAKSLRHGAHCRVSVVTPTTEGRAAYHERLWACFQAQEWPDKELIVVDTAREPSAFWLQEAQRNDDLIYVCMQQNFSIGLKRNMAVHLASGVVVANFDDDDIYAPNYIEAMVGHLEEHRLAALTLSAWYDYHVRSSRCGFVDPAAMHDLDVLTQKDEEGGGKEAKEAKEDKEAKSQRDEAVEQAAFGYGFSYVHRRGPALSNPYPDSWFGEDLAFMKQLRWALGKHSVGLMRDEKGICLHMMHGANTADSVAHRTVAPKEFKGLNVFKLKFDFASPARGPPPRATGSEPVGKFFSAEWKARRHGSQYRDATPAQAQQAPEAGEQEP